MNLYLAEDIKEYIVLYKEYLRSMCENLIKNLKMSKLGFDRKHSIIWKKIDKTKYVIPEDLQYLYDNYDVDCIYHECLFNLDSHCWIPSHCHQTHGILIRELMPFLEENFLSGIRVEYIKYVIPENTKFVMSKMMLEDYFTFFLDENPIINFYNDFSLIINLNMNSEYYSYIFLVDLQWSYEDEDEEYYVDEDDIDNLQPGEVIPTPIKLTFIAHNFTELAEKMVDKKDGLLARMWHKFEPLIN